MADIDSKISDIEKELDEMETKQLLLGLMNYLAEVSETNESIKDVITSNAENTEKNEISFRLLVNKLSTYIEGIRSENNEQSFRLLAESVSKYVKELKAEKKIKITNIDSLAINYELLQKAITDALSKQTEIISPNVKVADNKNYRRFYLVAKTAGTKIVWSPEKDRRWHITTLYIQVSDDITVTLSDNAETFLKGDYRRGSGLALPLPKEYPIASNEDGANLVMTTSGGNVFITVVGYEL